MAISTPKSHFLSSSNCLSDTSNLQIHAETLCCLTTSCEKIICSHIIAQSDERLVLDHPLGGNCWSVGCSVNHKMALFATWCAYAWIHNICKSSLCNLWNNDYLNHEQTNLFYSVNGFCANTSSLNERQERWKDWWSKLIHWAQDSNH